MELELFAVGLLLALAFAGMTGVHPGGIIVPGYLVLCLDQPGRLASTFAAAVLAYLAARVVARYVLLFGKRQFVLMILFGALCMFVIRVLSPNLLPFATEFTVLGWVIPGLIAHTFQKQGVLMTSSAIVIVTVGAYFAGRVLTSFV